VIAQASPWLLGALVAAMAWLSVGWVWPAVRAGAHPSPPLRLAGLVCLEALLVQLLSLAHAVTGSAVLGVHVILTLGAATLAARRGALRWPRLRRPRHPAAWALVATLAVLPAISATLYAPNTWDSMTYHLARVAHWLQHRTVAAYPTSIVRQVSSPPGAEYLILVLQAVTGTDRLDAFVQLGAWLALVAGAPRLARRLGAPARLAPWAAVLAGSAPMALLQASSTQNDLVAAAMALALVEAALPFVHARRRWRRTDLLVAASAVAAGLLVKPTSLVAAAPFALWGALGLARTLRDRGVARALLGGLGAGAAVVAGTLGLALALGARTPDRGLYGAYMYLDGLEAGDRLANVVRGVARHLPLPDVLEAAVSPGGNRISCFDDETRCLDWRVRPHEDFAGNPAQAALAVVLLGLAAARFGRLPTRARATAACVLAGWIGFHLLFRDNAWISRLQLPLFALGSLLVVAVPARAARAAAGLVPIAVAAALCVAGGRDALRNQIRPPLDPNAAAHGLDAGYYYSSTEPYLREKHQAVLDAMRDLRCARLGLVLSEDRYDYPLTWRAMQMGAEVRHHLSPDPWPCVVYVDHDRAAPPEGVAQGWLRPTPLPFLFIAGWAGAQGAGMGAGP
jgi:hypothetical protein